MVRKAETTEYRKELKGKILNKALEMFSSNGLRAVKMDDISHALSISKRTLYEIYPNKEDLIFEAIKTGNEISCQRLRERLSDKKDTMDIVTSFFKIHIEESLQINPLLFDDLQYYPAIQEFVQKQRAEHQSQVQDFFQRGKEDGYFRSDVNLALIHEMNSVFTDYFLSSRLYAKYDAKDIVRTLMITFVRGICTERGVASFDRVFETL